MSIMMARESRADEWSPPRTSDKVGGSCPAGCAHPDRGGDAAADRGATRALGPCPTPGQGRRRAGHPRPRRRRSRRSLSPRGPGSPRNRPAYPARAPVRLGWVGPGRCAPGAAPRAAQSRLSWSPAGLGARRLGPSMRSSRDGSMSARNGLGSTSRTVPWRRPAAGTGEEQVGPGPGHADEQQAPFLGEVDPAGGGRCSAAGARRRSRPGTRRGTPGPWRRAGSAARSCRPSGPTCPPRRRGPARP